MNSDALAYSNYMSRHTVKALTCVEPNAALVFCSDLYPGSPSDFIIVDLSGILGKLQSGDMILAEKDSTFLINFQMVSPEISRRSSQTNHILQRKKLNCSIK